MVSGQGGQGRRGMPCRRFTLLDGMIVVAGAAFGIVALKETFEDHALRDRWGFWVHPFVGFALVVSASLMLIFRLRRPRPTLRRIASQPGAVACFSIVAFSSASMVDNLCQEAFSQGLRVGYFSYDLSWAFLHAPQSLSAWGVVVCWTLLAVGRRWRPERGWIDGIGRALGWAWIFWGLSGFVLAWIEAHLNSMAAPVPGVNIM